MEATLARIREIKKWKRNFLNVTKTTTMTTTTIVAATMAKE